MLVNQTWIICSIRQVSLRPVTFRMWKLYGNLSITKYHIYEILLPICSCVRLLLKRKTSALKLREIFKTICFSTTMPWTWQHIQDWLFCSHPYHFLPGSYSRILAFLPSSVTGSLPFMDNDTSRHFSIRTDPLSLLRGKLPGKKMTENRRSGVYQLAVGRSIPLNIVCSSYF